MGRRGSRRPVGRARGCRDRSPCSARCARPAAAAPEPISQCSTTTGVVMAVDFAHWGGPLLRSCGTHPDDRLHAAQPGRLAHHRHRARRPGLRLPDRLHAATSGGTQYPTAARGVVRAHPAVERLLVVLARRTRARTPGATASSGPRATTPTPGSVELWMFGGTNVSAAPGAPAVADASAPRACARATRPRPQRRPATTDPRRAQPAAATRPPATTRAARRGGSRGAGAAPAAVASGARPSPVRADPQPRPSPSRRAIRRRAADPSRDPRQPARRPPVAPCRRSASRWSSWCWLRPAPRCAARPASAGPHGERASADAEPPARACAAAGCPRALHPVAWWLWAHRRWRPRPAAPPTRCCCCSSSPCSAFVVAARRTDAPWARAFRYYLLLALGRHRDPRRVPDGLRHRDRPERPHPVHAAARCPPRAGTPASRSAARCRWRRRCRPLLDGLRLASLLCCIGAANALANPKRALRVLPGALYELGVAVTSPSASPRS